MSESGVDIKEVSSSLSYASHEFKNPLTSIKAYLQLAKRQTLKQGDLATGELLDNADKQADRLNDLIRIWVEGMRSYYKISKISVKEVDYNKLLQKAAEGSSNNLNLKPESYPQSFVWGDENKLYEAIMILFSVFKDLQTDVILIKTKSDKGRVNTIINIPQKTDLSKIDLSTPFSREGDEVKLRERQLRMYLFAWVVRAHKGNVKITENGNKTVIIVTLPLVK